MELKMWWWEEREETRRGTEGWKEWSKTEGWRGNGRRMRGKMKSVKGRKKENGRKNSKAQTKKCSDKGKEIYKFTCKGSSRKEQKKDHNRWVKYEEKIRRNLVKGDGEVDKWEEKAERKEIKKLK